VGYKAFRQSTGKSSARLELMELVGCVPVSCLQSADELWHVQIGVLAAQGCLVDLLMANPAS